MRLHPWYLSTQNIFFFFLFSVPFTETTCQTCWGDPTTDVHHQVTIDDLRPASEAVSSSNGSNGTRPSDVSCSPACLRRLLDYASFFFCKYNPWVSWLSLKLLFLANPCEEGMHQPRIFRSSRVCASCRVLRYSLEVVNFDTFFFFFFFWDKDALLDREVCLSSVQVIRITMSDLQVEKLRQDPCCCIEMTLKLFDFYCSLLKRVFLDLLRPKA
jgi:hypothetical protein